MRNPGKHPLLVMQGIGEGTAIRATDSSLRPE
jgi:hypothetical protein